jgi:nucleoside-diphosphate-sugar epimerase
MTIKIAITGANGFIGTNLVEVLQKQNDIETIAMVYPGTDESIIQKMNCKIMHGDMMNVESMLPIFEGCDCVVHLAGLVTEWASKQAFQKYIVDATKKVFEASIRTRVKKFVFMSSLTVQGFRPFGACEMNENDEYHPCNDYAQAKMECEKYLLEEGKNHGIKIIIVRPAFTIFGKYDRTSFIQYLDAIAKNKVPLLDKGRAICSFVYAENLAHGIAFLSTDSRAEGIFNISDVNMRWRDFISTVCEIGGFKPPKSSVPSILVKGPVWLLESVYKLFRIKHSPIVNLYRLKIQSSTLSCSSARIHQLGFEPPIDFKEGIIRTIAYYKQNFK